MAVEEQTEGTLYAWVYDAASGRFGQRLTIPDREVTKLAHWISKKGSPTGDVTFTIRKVSDDSIILSKVWGDASGVLDGGTGGGWIEVTFDTPATINEEVRILFEFSTGDANNCLGGFATTNVKADEVCTRFVGGSYSDASTKDARYRYTYTDVLAVTIQPMTDVLFPNAKAHGTITLLGETPCTQHGHCWSTSPSPTIADNKTELGAVASVPHTFESTLTDLLLYTTYYIRAYATDGGGTVYSSEVSFTPGIASYAYVAAYVDDALTIIDISDLSTPSFKGSIQGAGAPNYLNYAMCVYVLGNYAYLGCLLDNALTIIDISNPAAPTFKGSIQGAGAPNYLGEPRAVFVLGNYAYLGCLLDNALTIIDVSNPASPTFKGSIQGTGSPNYLSSPRGVFVRGNLAYVAAMGDNALTIIDISNPAAPTFKGSIHGSGAPNYLGEARGVFVKGNYAYVAASADDSLTIIDVSNPASPTLAGRVTHGTYLEGARGVFVKGNYAYVAATTGDALAIVDVTNKGTPSIAGVISGAGAPNYLNGASGVFVEGNYAHVASLIDNSLTVIDVSDPASPSFVGNIMGAGAPNYLDGPWGISPLNVPAFKGGLSRAYALARREL